MNLKQSFGEENSLWEITGKAEELELPLRLIFGKEIVGL